MNRNMISPYVRVAMYSTLASGFVIGERDIFDFELIYVGGGSCELCFEGVKYTCKKGDAVLIPPGVRHSFTVGEDEFVQPHVHFDAVYGENSEITPVSFRKREKMSDEERALIQENVFADSEIPYIFTPTDPTAFGRLFFGVIDAFLAKSRGYELICKARMTELLCLILNQFDGNVPTPADTGRVDSVKGYIDANYRQIITLDMLEKQFYANKFTLMRNFKKAYRVNIINYYRARRLEYAKRALRGGSLTVGALAEQLNFTDIYSFSRFFKQQTGMSPSEYREKKGGAESL